MKRREQRECIFQLLFRVEFNGREEMSEQAGLFLEEIRERFGLERLGAFTFMENAGSIRVLEKNGFRLAESFTENGVASGYYERIPSL